MQVHLCKKVQKTGERNVAFLHVCVPWLTGLLIGAVVSFYLSGNNLTIARSLPLAKVSFFGVLLSSLLPFLIVVIISKFVGQGVLTVYLFLKAAAFSLTFCYCAKCFGSAGWLLIPILFITDIICSYLLLLFIYKLFSNTAVSKCVFMNYVGLSVLFGIFNYFVLSPFTASLF